MAEMTPSAAARILKKGVVCARYRCSSACNVDPKRKSWKNRVNGGGSVLLQQVLFIRWSFDLVVEF